MSNNPGQPVRPQRSRHPPLGEEEQGRVVLHPDLRLVANPIEAHFGPLRQFTIANSNHPNHTVQTGSAILEPARHGWDA
jgi:hypothetical protein